MADKRAERMLGGAAKAAPSDELASFLAEWAALDSLPWEDEVPADAEILGDTPSVEADKQETEGALDPAGLMPRMDAARSADLRTALQQAHLRLTELDEKMAAVNQELESLRVLGAQLTSEYEAVHRVASEAQDLSAAVASIAEAVQQQSLAAYEEFARRTDERFDALNKLMREMSVRTATARTLKHTLDDTEEEALSRNSCAALTDTDPPRRTISHGRFAARAAGACLPMVVIGLLVIAPLVRRSQMKANRPLDTSAASPSHNLNSAAATNSASSERTIHASPSSGAGVDRKFSDPSSPGGQRGEHATSSPSPIGTSASMETRPDIELRDNESILSGLPPPKEDLSGWWILTSQIERSSVNADNDLPLGFRVQLDQRGNRVSGHGFGLLENARSVTSQRRTPITVYGTVAGNRLALTFTERGARRTRRGRFQMELMQDGSLDGRFSSDAAGSGGRAHAVRMPAQQK